MSKNKVLFLTPNNKKFHSLKKVSNKTGIPIDVEKDVKSGYEMLKKGKYNLVISNLFAKKLNGYDLISKIKKDNINCGVILIIGDEKEKIKEELAKKGVFSFVKRVDSDIEISNQINNYFKKQSVSELGSKSSLEEAEFDIKQNILKKTKALDYLNDKLKDINKEIDQTKECLKKSKEYLTNSERQISIGQMTASIVHEINNPLTAIVSLVSAICLKCKDEHNVEKYNELLIDNFDKLKSLIGNILSFASPKTGRKKEDVNVNDAIEDILSFYTYEINKNGITLKKKFSDDLPYVNIPKISIQQIALNVLKNAVFAVKSEKGTITIKTSMEDVFVVVEIKDNGNGIPKSEIEDIFKPFFSTKPKNEGAGLGLFICKEILKKYNGDIEVKSALNRGTRVIIKLPVLKIESN
jgi:C4-dicarboxylate-specific signal transduction histidine kinase/translation initiation factor 1 (eIF-1/SUI1)